MDDVRKSDRCIIDDGDFAALLYSRVISKLKELPSLLSQIMNYKLQGVKYAACLKERLRIFRYDPGCLFYAT